jgi:mitochondrial fission protein ELM1
MNIIIKDEIWILSDNRPGTVSQAIGLAKEIGFEYKIIDLEYSIFASLPNFILSSSPFRLSIFNRQEFQNSRHLPRLIISAGRRCAPIALFLKKLSQNQTKIIQIMHPNLSFKKFDLVILPKHDGYKEDRFNNLVTTIGALNKINQNDILSEREKFANYFANIEKTKIALMLGGSSNKTQFTAESAINLAKIMSKIAKNMDATLLVLSSRRTDEELLEALKSNLNCDFKFFDYAKIKDENPYLAIVGYADFFVITGDSVSMISECCSVGKSVYIFDEKNISTKKHRRFHHNLFDENYAKKLTRNLKKLTEFSPKILQETKRIAAIIRADFS